MEPSQPVAIPPEKIGGMPVGAWLRLLGETDEDAEEYDPRQNGAVGVFQMVGNSAVIRRVLLPLDDTGSTSRSRGRAARVEELRRDIVQLGEDGSPASCSCPLFRKDRTCRHLDEVRDRLPILRDARRPGSPDTTSPDALEVLIEAFQAPREDPRGGPASHYAGGYQPKGLWSELQLESALLQLPAKGLVDGGILTYESRLARSLEAVFGPPRPASDDLPPDHSEASALNPLRARLLLVAGMTPAQIQAAERNPRGWLRWAIGWAISRPGPEAALVLTAFGPASREQLEGAIEALERRYRELDGPVEEGTLPAFETAHTEE
jgi:hypothetical protein